MLFPHLTFTGTFVFDLIIHVLFGAQDVQVKQVVIFGMQFWEKVKCRYYEKTKRVSVGEKHETLVEPFKTPDFNLFEKI